MRKIYALCIFFLSLFILFFFSITQNPVFASCHNLPKVPFTINPTSGTATTNFTATIQWSQLSQDDFQRFKNIDLHLTAYENDTPISTSRAINSYYVRTHTDSSLRISDFFVPSGQHTLKLRLLGNGFPRCPMESSTPTIIVMGATTVTKKSGDICDPNLQNDPLYACPPGDSCIQIKGAYQCGIPPGTPFQPKLCDPIGGKKDGGVQTAVGCIPTDAEGLVSFLLRLILGLSGGIALLLIIFSGYRMATSAGNPETLQGARETLTSAIIGLVFIILAIVILRVIGVEILRIPGFE